MLHKGSLWFCLLALAISAAAHAAEAPRETLVFFRHAEKPEAEIGQLSCQGLNRSLKLPAVLEQKFGRPDYLFAPNPAVKVESGGSAFFYLRPLTTIQPAAIYFGKPVDVSYGLNQVQEMSALLLERTYHGRLSFIAWEYSHLPKLIAAILLRIGDTATKVPKWDPDDFDSLYILKLGFTQDRVTGVDLSFDREGLDGQDTTCHAS